MSKIIFILLLGPFLCFSQERNPDSSAINEIVRKIDKLSETGSRSFTNHKTIGHKRIKENWQRFEHKQLSRIIINYKVDSTDYTEEYYFRDGALIYASEKEIRYFPSLGPNEYVAWSGSFYFSKQKLIDHVTLGHGKSESEDWDPEKEILQRLKVRKTELDGLK